MSAEHGAEKARTCCATVRGQDHRACAETAHNEHGVAMCACRGRGRVHAFEPGEACYPTRVLPPQGEGAGCDCAELCSMGPTCPGGMLARLPGSGCWRMACPDGRQHSWMQWPDGATRCRHCGECRDEAPDA